MPAPLTISDVLSYLHNQADQQDLDSITQASRTRRKALGEQQAAVVRIGLTVRLDGLSPNYLNGLTGTVSSLAGTHAQVRLDTASTRKLRTSSRRFHIPADTEEHLLGGIPKACCQVA